MLRLRTTRSTKLTRSNSTQSKCFFRRWWLPGRSTALLRQLCAISGSKVRVASSSVSSRRRPPSLRNCRFSQPGISASEIWKLAKCWTTESNCLKFVLFIFNNRVVHLYISPRILSINRLFKLYTNNAETTCLWFDTKTLVSNQRIYIPGCRISDTMYTLPDSPARSGWPKRVRLS